MDGLRIEWNPTIATVIVLLSVALSCNGTGTSGADDAADGDRLFREVAEFDLRAAIDGHDFRFSGGESRGLRADGVGAGF